MIRALTLIVIGAASFVAVYMLVPTSAPQADAPPAAAPASDTMTEAGTARSSAEDVSAAVPLDLRPGAEGPHPSEEEGRTVRDVTPASITAGPRVTGTLARVDLPAPPPSARSARLFNPIVLAAGTFKVRDREIHLAGIHPPAFDELCGEGAAAWPCGRIARTALRNMIRGRAIECEIPAGTDNLPDSVSCIVGGDDIATWLVAQGWAKRSGDAFEGEERKAREAKLGLWADRRPDHQPDEIAAGG
jgi:endonuclease YncB( thermonuclease family)